MISTQGASDATSTVRVKALDSHQVRSEQKDLEIEEEEPANNDIAVDEHESADEQEPAEHEVQLGLSSRASALKEYLQDKTEAKAIILKADGSSEEISFSASSAQTRSLLSSRPSIVGEIEELQIVVVKALDSSNDASSNKHTLPVPLCHDQSNGDYVLFRVDADGKVVDLSLSEYQKYVEAHKTLTETAVKQYNAANDQIKSHSPFGSDSKHTMQRLRGALENKLRSQSQSEEESKLSDVDIRAAVNKELQKLVDDAINALESSPMVDQDYNPEEDQEIEVDAEEEEEVEIESVQSLDTRSWREQLKDALEHVADLGRVDGEDFAEMICDTFCELNGTEPSLKQLTNLYSQIRADFANEAEEELDDESSAAESETEEEEEEEIEVEEEEESEDEDGQDEDEWDQALNNIRRLGRADGRALAERVCDALYEENGEEPTLEELTSAWESIQDSFAVEARESVELDVESEIDEDADHQDKSTMVEMTPMESLQFALKTIGSDWVSRANSLYLNQKGRAPDEDELADTIRAFALEMAESVLAKHIGFETDLDDDVEMESVEEEFDEEEEEVVDSDYDPENVVDQAQAILDEGDEMLEMESEQEETDEKEDDSDYHPDNAMDQAQADRDAVEDWKHDREHFDQIMLNTPVTTSRRGGGVSWDVFFDEDDLNKDAESANLEKSIDGFKMMNKRDPTPSEVTKMKQFLSVPIEICDEQSMEIESSAAVIQTPIITSKHGGVVSWTVYFGQSNGDMDSAVSSFERVYHREPTSLELHHLRSFMTGQTASDGRSEETATLRELRPSSPSKVLVSPVTEKKTAKRFNVYLEDSKLSQEETEGIAIKWFKRFNKREPTDEDLDKIRAFIQKDADLQEQEFMVPAQALKFEDEEDDDDMKQSELPTLSTTKGLVKDGATGYTLNFDDDEKRENGDEEQAIQWFKRFNNREPSKEESQRIKQFVQVDADDMIDIE